MMMMTDNLFNFFFISILSISLFFNTYICLVYTFFLYETDDVDDDDRKEKNFACAEKGAMLEKACFALNKSFSLFSFHQFLLLTFSLLFTMCDCC